MTSFEILVTGATGFVGKVLIRKLVKKYGNKKILCLVYDYDSPMEISGRKLLDKLGVSYKLVDLTSKSSLSKILNLPKNPKLVIHLAAEVDTAKRKHIVNVMGVENLYYSMGKLDKHTHFIHIGTMIEVVGRPDCSKPVNESSKDYPTNEYTRTKLEGEKFITSKSIKDKFKLTVIRPNTIYGKGIRKNSLFDMVTRMVKNGSVITRINWPGRSALIHVDDLTDIIMSFTDNPPPVPGVPQKFLAYSENLTIYNISKTIHQRLSIPFKPLKLPSWVWSLVKQSRRFIPLLENVLPYSVYNSFWRFGIITDDVVWCNSDKLFNKFKNLRPKLFKDVARDVM